MSFCSLTSTVAVVILGLLSPQKNAPKPPTAPETFRAILDAKSGTGKAGAAAYLDIKIDKYTTDKDHDALTAALKGGQQAFTDALRKAPSVGTMMFGNDKVVIRYAREKRTGEHSRVITVVTEKPVYFLGGGAVNAKPREGFDVAVAQFTMDDGGVGNGKMAAAAKVKPGGETGVEIEDYADKPIMLTSINRAY